MAVIISGKDLSQELKDNMKEEILSLKEKYGREPHLVVILVHDDCENALCNAPHRGLSVWQSGKSS